MRTEPCSGWIDSDRSEARGVDIRCDIRGRYFYISGDEVRRPGSKLVVQAVWYGMTRTPFTWDLIEELCGKAGDARVVRCAFRRTASAHAGIVELDDRERESLFVEAVRQARGAVARGLTGGGTFLATDAPIWPVVPR